MNTIRPRHSALSRRRFLMALAPTVGLMSPACASAGSSSGNRRDPNVLTQGDLAPFMEVSLDDAIRSRRGNWLRRGGLGQTDLVQVYVNGSKFGDASVLRDIAVRNVLRIEYMSGPDATTRFGTGNGGGALLVTMR